jgi:DNA-binding XRE family transcriptional regulator
MMGPPYPNHGFDSTVLFLLFCLRDLHLSFLFVQRLESPAPARRKERKMYFNQVEFGKRLKKARKAMNFTQEELAEILGVERLHITRMERGVVACSIDLLLDLSCHLQVSTDYLLKGESEEMQYTRDRLMAVIRELSSVAESL